MKVYLKVIGCSCYTCLPRTAQAAAQTANTSKNSTSTHEHMAKNKAQQ